MELQDAHARKKAIDPQGSYAVSAPAGSGKTELLIQRTLSLLSTVEQPENILGITFTRKAANEMRERVLKALKDSQQAENELAVLSAHERETRELALSVLARDQELGWNLLENPGRLRFQTIDGLCRQLANQLCLETGIVVPPSMSEDSKSLYLKAAEKTLDFMDDKGPVGDSLRLLIEHLDGHLEKLVELIADLLSSRDSWLPIIIPRDIDQDYLQERVEALVEETLLKAGEVLLPYSSELEDLLDYACKHKQSATWLDKNLCNNVPEAEPDSLPQWKAIRNFLITGKPNDAKYRSPKVDKRMGFPTESENVSKAEAKSRKERFAVLIEAINKDDEFFQTLNSVAILPDLNGEDFENSPINQAIFSLLPVAAACFNTLAQEIGETDFTAVAIAAIEALGQPDRPTPLALRMDYRIQHILVDEFQDTSGVQIDLLERLTSGWQPEDGRTLFIVGDGMQSIYGFRKANVSLFIRARREGIGDIEITPLDLTANFRSDKQIVSWVNQSFSTIFPNADNLVQGQVGFKESEAVKRESQWSVNLNGYASAALEAEAIAEDIEQKFTQGDNDLAILVRGRRHLELILPALRARKIKWQAQDIDPLANRMAVMDIHSLTRALCVPADRIAWLSILRAPWAGMDMSDLLHLCEWKPDRLDKKSSEDQVFPPVWCALSERTAIEQLSPDGTEIANRLRSYFETAFSQLGQKPLRTIVEKLWRSLDAHEALIEPRDLQDVKDYLDLLEQEESGGLITDWRAFQRRLEELYSQPGTDSEVRLQIMTIHKSKGLEFDHVYLPALDRTTGQNTEPLMLWWQREYEDGSEGYLLAAKPSQRDKRPEYKDRQSLYHYLKAEESERQRQEVARLLYVACTRARKSLFLTATLGWDDKNELIKKPSGNSMLSILWSLYEEQFSHNFQPVFDHTEEQVAVLDKIRRLPVDRLLKEHSSEKPATGTRLVTSYQFSDNYLARITGDLIHHSLMRIVREKISQPSAKHFMEDWLLGISGKGIDKEQQKIIGKLENMLTAILSDQTGQWILSTEHEGSSAELKMDYLDAQGSVQLAIIDRTFIDNGTRWVVDYKSSMPREDEPLEQFLKSEAEKYKAQMKRYLSLFHTDNKRAMLYFPAISSSIEIERL